MDSQDMTYHDKAILNLKLAARDAMEGATVAYYTDSDFHKESLADSVARLEKAIREYKESK